MTRYISVCKLPCLTREAGFLYNSILGHVDDRVIRSAQCG